MIGPGDVIAIDTVVININGDNSRIAVAAPRMSIPRLMRSANFPLRRVLEEQRVKIGKVPISIRQAIKHTIGVGCRRAGKGQIVGSKSDFFQESLRPLRVGIWQENGNKIVAEVTQDVGFPLVVVNETKSLNDIVARAIPFVVEVEQCNGQGNLGTLRPSLFVLQDAQEVMPGKNIAQVGVTPTRLPEGLPRPDASTSRCLREALWQQAPMGSRVVNVDARCSADVRHRDRGPTRDPVPRCLRRYGKRGACQRPSPRLSKILDQAFCQGVRDASSTNRHAPTISQVDSGAAAFAIQFLECSAGINKEGTPLLPLLRKHMTPDVTAAIGATRSTKREEHFPPVVSFTRRYATVARCVPECIG